MRFNPSLPYPVLYTDNDHYKKSHFSVQVEANESFGQLLLDVTFTLKNKEIEQLIKDKHATYAMHIECSQTSYRKVITSFLPTISYKISEQQLRGKIDVHFFILANDRIENFTSSDWNNFYQNLPITYEKSNPLAIATPIEITLFEEPIADQKLPSIISVRKVTQNEFVTIELATNQIFIQMPEETYNQYTNYGDSSFKQTILSLVILPALIEVFYQIKMEPSVYEDYHWYKVIEQIFIQNGTTFEDVIKDDSSIFVAVQRLLHNPIINAFKEIDKNSSKE